jgi:hypothetical protein
VAVEAAKKALEAHPRVVEYTDGVEAGELRAKVRLTEDGAAVGDLAVLFIHTYDPAAPSPAPAN